MSNPAFAELQDQFRTRGPVAAFEWLASMLREQREYDKLFDALCLRKKFELGIPLNRPTSFQDVPSEQRPEFQAAYAAAAREVGQLLLDDHQLSQSFVYFHALGDTQLIRDAIDVLPLPNESNETSEELIDLAFYKFVHPVKGMQIMLKTHGTCSTITALDQAFMNLDPELRSAFAALLVTNLHHDLSQSILRDIQRQSPSTEPASTIHELISGRDWLFTEHNYHIDVSHLNSTVRFARALKPEQPELTMARDLAEYGSRLAEPFQYAGDPPFAEFYPAHIQFFNFLLNQGRDEARAYFQRKLEEATDPTDQAMTAYVLVDLLAQTDQIEATLPLAEKYLVKADHDFASAFAELCQKAGRFDVLLRSAEERGDMVTYVAALAEQSPAMK